MYGLCNCKNANNQLYSQPDSSIEMYQEKKCTAINKIFIEKMLNITNNSASKLEYCSFLQLFFNNSIPTHEKECAYYNGLLKQIQIDEKQGYEICDEFVTDVINRLEQHKMMKDGLSEMARFIDSKIQEISSSTQSEQ